MTDVLITEFRLNDKVSAAASKISSAMKGATNSLSAGQNKFRNFTGQFGDVVGFGLKAGAVFGAGAAAVLAFGNAASVAAGDFDALKKALATYTNSNAQLEAQLAVLKEIAKQPGLGFEEAIKGAVRLQAAGFSFKSATDSIREFGNALAAAGGSKEDLDGVLLALTQIAAKGKISAEELNQIQERVPQIRSVVKGQFGTADGEQLAKMGVTVDRFLQGILAGLSQLPRAAESAKTVRENLQDDLKQALVQIGDAVNVAVVPFLKEFGANVQALVSSGALTTITNQFLGLSNGVKGIGPLFEGFIYFIAEAPHRIKTFIEGLQSFGVVVWKIVTFGVNKWIEAIDAFLRAFNLKGVADNMQKLISNTNEFIKEVWHDTWNSGAGEEAVNKWNAALKQPQAAIDTKLANGEDKVISPMVQTATNTAKLVELTQKQVDLSNQILGGGTVSAAAASQVNLTRAMGGLRPGATASSKAEAYFREAVRALVAEVMGTQIAGVRSGGTFNGVYR